MITAINLLAILLQTSTLTVTSSAFKEGEAIPSKYTCEGENLHPEITITDVPSGTKNLVIIMDDPDATNGTFVHWVVFNIAPSEMTKKTVIKENANPGIKGANGRGENKYTGPCPPQGNHHYHFKVYALDAMLSLKEGADKMTVEAAMKDHILAQTVLIGMYEKMKK